MGVQRYSTSNTAMWSNYYNSTTLSYTAPYQHITTAPLTPLPICYTLNLCRTKVDQLHVQYDQLYLRQSSVEINDYSVTYFNHIAAFKALYR